MKMLCSYLIGCALLVGSLSAFAASGDWPQWRGPNRDGISPEKGLLQQWPAGGPPLAWKAEGLGKGYSSISVAGNRILTMGDLGEDCFVIALSRADGKQLWSAKLGKSGASVGAVLKDRAAHQASKAISFCRGQWGELLCLGAADGKERWRKDLTKDFGGKRPEWGYAESPLIDAEKVW
jgi:hypothetical protein